MSHFENVAFKTIDGLTLRGCLYPAKQKGPGIILTPGFNCVKEMFVPDVAEHFQRAGITALTYDPRTLGVSDGLPRNDLDPVQQAQDYHDALSFLKTHPLVDEKRIAYWGFSFAGMIALTAAAMDKRAKLVIAVCPLTIFDLPQHKRQKVMSRAMQDRESQLSGNPPSYVPVLTEAGENPAGFGVGTAKEDFNIILNAKTLAPNYENRTTIQTYYRIQAWHPLELLPLIGQTPTMIVTAVNDQISPAENQQHLFAKLTGPKQIELVPNKGHMDALSGEDFPRVMEMQVEFIRQYLSG